MIWSNTRTLTNHGNIVQWHDYENKVFVIRPQGLVMMCVFPEFDGVYLDTVPEKPAASTFGAEEWH